MTVARALLLAGLCLCALPASAAEILTLQGLGPVRIGMRFAEVEKVVGRKIPFDENVSGGPAGCAQTGWPGKDGPGFMFEHNRLTRIDVSERGITTAEGAGVGSTETQLKTLYGRRAIFTSHPYLEDAGHYVTVRYPQQNRRLIFETEQGKVTSFRIGLPKSTEYIEGCL